MRHSFQKWRGNRPPRRNADGPEISDLYSTCDFTEKVLSWNHSLATTRSSFGCWTSRQSSMKSVGRVTIPGSRKRGVILSTENNVFNTLGTSTSRCKYGARHEARSLKRNVSTGRRYPERMRLAFMLTAQQRQKTTAKHAPTRVFPKDKEGDIRSHTRTYTANADTRSSLQRMGIRHNTYLCNVHCLHAETCTGRKIRRNTTLITHAANCERMCERRT